MRDLACCVQNVRVVQRNLVYVVGLPMELCYEDMLSSVDYIGQYGKIVKVRGCPGMLMAEAMKHWHHRHVRAKIEGLLLRFCQA